MSTSTITGAIGGVIGFYIGGPTGAQWGWVIGSTLGALADPQKIEGPRLTNFQGVASQDGTPICRGDGTFPVPKACVIWQSDVTTRRHTESGKGGPEQVTYTYHRDYAILVHKGQISGYKIIRRAGKIVYDARTDAELTAIGYTDDEIAETRAAQAKFLQEATLYYGTADQMPDPTITAHKGAGNVPAWRGYAYIVMTGAEGASGRGEVDQFEFVVSACGDRTEDDTPPKYLLVTGQAKTTGGPLLAVAKATETPTFEGIAQSTGADATGLPYHYDGRVVVASDDAARYTDDIFGIWTASGTPPNENLNGIVGGPAGWLAYNHSKSLTGTGFWHAPQTPDVWTNYYPDTGVWHISYADGYYWLSAPGTLYRATSPDGPWESHGSGVYDWLDIVEHKGYLYATCNASSSDTGDWQIRRSADRGATWSEPLLTVEYTGHRPYFLCPVGDYLVAWCLGGGVWTDANNWAEWIDTGVGGSGNPGGGANFLVTGGRKIAASDSRAYVIGNTDKLAVFDPATLTVSDPITMPVGNMIGIAAVDYTQSLSPIPDAPGYYLGADGSGIVGPNGTQISVCTPTLGSLVSKDCGSVGVTSISVSELTDLVKGRFVAGQSSPKANIDTLRKGYFFDISEFDGIAHFPKRGGEDSFSLTVDDLCVRDDEELVQWERMQESELLRKVTFGYVDPATNYTATTQQWERRATTVKAKGEGTSQLAIVGDKDWAAQAAEKSGKIAWAEPDKCSFAVSIARSDLVPAAVGPVTDEDGVVHRIRIEAIKDDGLIRFIDGRRTRADVYESGATGAQKKLPRFPGSNIRGPTDGLLLNMPVSVDSNDVPGIAWAAAGYLGGWVGTVLQIQRAGQWVEVGRTDVGCAMGTLLADLPAHAGDIDTANVLSVRMNAPLESVTFTNLLQERNPLAIVYPDGTTEIVQFQTATETSAGEYELTTLLRGRLNTEVGDHAAGARVVFLDTRVKYAALEPTDIGTTLSYRFISMGTDPDAAPVQTLDLTTMESQREWPVFDLAVSKAGDDYTVTWRKRDRLGTDVFPIRSTNWRGYEVGYSYGGNTHTETVLTESITFNLPGASDITFSVAQINLYTGAGPAETVHIP